MITTVIGMLLGGTVISALGGLSEYVKENQFPSIKAVVRDFIIGSILMVFILQFVPSDSIDTILSYIPSFDLTKLDVSTITGVVEPDLQVGPVKF